MLIWYFMSNWLGGPFTKKKIHSCILFSHNGRSVDLHCLDKRSNVKWPLLIMHRLDYTSRAEAKFAFFRSDDLDES